MPTKTKGKRGGRHGGGYAGYRDQATQMTPRQMVDDRRARLLGLEIMERQKQLVARSEVEAGERECAAVIQSDLFGALPSRLATVLGGRKLDAEAVRQAALGIVSEIVGGWTDAGIVKQEAKHAETATTATHQGPDAGPAQRPAAHAPQRGDDRGRASRGRGRPVNRD